MAELHESKNLGCFEDTGDSVSAVASYLSTQFATLVKKIGANAQFIFQKLYHSITRFYRKLPWKRSSPFSGFASFRSSGPSFSAA